MFKGALSVGATRISEGMKVAAATALADVVGDGLDDEHVVPSVFDPTVAPSVAVRMALVNNSGRACRLPTAANVESP